MNKDPLSGSKKTIVVFMASDYSSENLRHGLLIISE